MSPGLKKLIGNFLAFCLLAFVACAEDKPEPAKPGEEEVVRQRFLVAFQTAQNVDRKIELIDSLKGLKERDSMRLMAGMLGDGNERVRQAACSIMTVTPDTEGYFVKPLMGALTDPSPNVRIAAAEALSAAKIRGDAIKALTLGLMTTLGGEVPKAKAGDSTRIAEAYSRALEKLTGEHALPENDIRKQSNIWMEFWKKNETEIRAADEKLLAVPPPERSKDLGKDSFDK